LKRIWKYLQQHVRADFNVKHYGFVFIFLTAALFINYTFNFDDLVLKSQTGFTKFIYYFLFYAFSYYVPLLTVSRSGDKNFFRKKLFWIKSIVGIAVLSLDSSAFFLRDLITTWFEFGLQLWAYKVIINLMGVITVLLPLYVMYLRYDKSQSHYYGLSPKRFDTSPYFQMLLIMLPLLTAASFLPSFMKQYPMYRVSDAHILLQVPEWVTVLIYEFAYGLDFITVELLFRGFFVIGMIQIMGRHSVLAMAVMYCFLHTGKPLGEAISSVFGGYVLGVVAFETRSVWGGVIVHVGIAWMMEIIGFGQKIGSGF
jgi:hypothetical protein